MGIFKFAKNAGNAAVKKAADKAKQDTLKTVMEKFGFPPKVKVKVDDDVVHISGKVPDQATREKIILAAGNVEGIGTVREEMTTVEKSRAAKMHEVKKGDTLSKIAKKVYGDPMQYPAIFDANKPMLKHPDKIFPGQLLRCPPIKGVKFKV